MFILWSTWLAILSLNSVLFSMSVSREEKTSFFILSSLIFFYCQVIGIFTILGFFGMIHPAFITAAFLLVTFLLGLARRGTGTKILMRSMGFPPLYAFPFLAVAASYCLNAYYRMPMPPLTTDGLLYHLPFAVEFARSGSTKLVPLYFVDVSMTYYPQGGSMLYLFTLFSGKEFLFKFVQAPFALIGGIALYAMAEDNDLPPLLAISAFCIFTLIRPVIKEAFLCYVDLFSAAAFLSALCSISSPDRKRLPLAVLSSALLMTSKNFVLIFLLPLIPFFFTVKNGRTARRYLAGSVIFFILVGCFTYIRNLVLTGNPVYPATVSAGNSTLFHGLFSYDRKPFGEALAGLWNLFLRPVTSTDPAGSVSALFFVSLPVSLAISFFRNRRLFYAFLAIPISFLLYMAAIPPGYHQVRHLLPVYSLLSLSLVYPFRYAGKLAFALPLICLYFLAESLVSVSQLLECLILASIFFFPFLFLSRKKRHALSLAVPALFIATFLAWSFTIASDIYEKVKTETWKNFYGKEAEAWEFVQENSGGGRKIAYAGEFLLYPFYGKNFENDLFYQSVNGSETLPVHRYGKSNIRFTGGEAAFLYRENPSLEAWLTGLREKDTDWIVIRKGKPLVEYEWTSGNERIFRLIFSNEVADIYSFGDPARKK